MNIFGTKKILLAVAVLAAIANFAGAAEKEISIPAGTKARASFITEGGKGPEVLFDGNEETFMTPGGGTCTSEDQVTSVFFTFPAPVENLAGVVTGASDKFHNYYPKVMEFWVDTNGDGKFDTPAGITDKLGGGDKCKGKHMFDGRVPKAFGIGLRVTRQNTAGAKRAWFMNQIKLVTSDKMPVLKPDPAKFGKRDENAGTAGDGGQGTGQAAPSAQKTLSLEIFKDKDAIDLPQGTKISASFRTEKDKGPEVLFDGDENTFMTACGGTCSSPDQTTSIFLRFPQPLENLGGVITGVSDKFHNYYPKKMEFWADSNNDGRFDTLVGSTDKLGPADQCIGKHIFNGRLPQAHGLEIRVVQQHVGGGKRAWTMNEMKLVASPELPIIAATPNSHRVLQFEDTIPRGSTISANFECEPGKGPELLLDGDATTFMNPKAGTAVEGRPSSLFLRFPETVNGLAGIRIGKSDPYGNYKWEEMQIWADTNGDGKYDIQAGSFSGGGEGNKRFPKTLDTAHGLELRVTRQTRKGINRAFMLNDLNALLFMDIPDEGEMRFVAEDFEDLSSWRVWAENTNQPEGERYYGGYTYICGEISADAPFGQAIGRLRYCFKEPKPNSQNWLRAKRGTVSELNGIIDAISFYANPQGYPCSINFEIIDSKGRKAGTPSVKLEGNEWKEYKIDLSANAWPQGAMFEPPMRIEHLFLRSEKGGTGDVLLDNITIVGAVSREHKVTIKPVWEGLAYSPEKPLTVKYRVRNSLSTPVSAPLTAKLFSSFDPLRTNPVAETTRNVEIPAWGEITVKIDYGKPGYGHYEAELAISERGIAAKHTDFIGVLEMNGKRINKKPMWIGSMHPGGWISDPENQFVLNNVVVPLGLDCYRTGSPSEAKNLIDAGLLLAAGAGGGLPKHLHKQGVNRPDLNEPNDYDGYRKYWLERAAKEYAPFKEHIISVEYFNEPDLPGFEYIPEIDVYLKMWRTWAAAMREGAPGIRLGTGSCTVQHGKAKKDFNDRMYTELAKEADVAVWHAHGPLNNYVSRHRMVENWLRKGGRSDSKMLLGNSEAGAVSFSSAPERIAQADTLVKKIGWAKSQPNSLFYIWFTTTDTYDPQGGYLGGTNWGLIRYNQRLKASGQAMNEIVRRLSNTEGLGEVSLDSRLQACAYRHDGGGMTWLFWPNETGARFLVNLSANGPLELSDMFGKTVKLSPASGRVSFQTNGYPMYLSGAAGITISPAVAPKWITVPSIVGVSPGSRLETSVSYRNIWGKESEILTKIEDSNGTAVSEETFKIASGAQHSQKIGFELPQTVKAGTVGYVLTVSVPSQGLKESLPLMVAVGELVPKSTSPIVSNGKFARPRKTGKITMDSVEFVHDLVDDPQTPRWAGTADLSATAHLAHDSKGIYIRIDVRDQTHIPGEAGEKLWANDSVQIGIASEGKQTEIGITEKNGGFAWRWLCPSGKTGPIKSSVAAQKEKDITTYECYLPFKDISAEYRPGMMMRFTILVNEDDGRGRVRLLKWFDGIHPGKDLEKFGYIVLE